METETIEFAPSVFSGTELLPGPARKDLVAGRDARKSVKPQRRFSHSHVVVGVIESVCGRSRARIELSTNASAVQITARTIVPLATSDVGHSAVIAFEEGDQERPIIIGLLRQDGGAEEEVNVVLDGKRIVLRGSREVVLRCGGASITLTHAGKVLIQGEYIVTRSKGANRIKGASVQIN
jgi:hypothetical protein